MVKSVELEYLYLDLSTCTRCQGSDDNLREAITKLTKAHPEVRFSQSSIHIDSITQAVRHGFVSSPTLRVNGRDLPIELKEDDCRSCGDFCGDSVDCRLWHYEGKDYTSVPAKMVVETVGKFLRGEIELIEVDKDAYQIPENILNFFDARRRKESTEKAKETSCGCQPTSCCG